MNSRFQRLIDSSGHARRSLFRNGQKLVVRDTRVGGAGSTALAADWMTENIQRRRIQGLCGVSCSSRFDASDAAMRPGFSGLFGSSRYRGQIRNCRPLSATASSASTASKTKTEEDPVSDRGQGGTLDTLYTLSSQDPFTHKPRRRVAVIGAGAVGSATAAHLILQRVCSEVILVDIDRNRCEGEALDLQDMGFVTGIPCRAGTFEAAGEAEILVITAGAAQKPGESRLSLIGRNKKILTSIFESMGRIRTDSIVIVVSNPCDILTYLAMQIAGLNKRQVFGSGTFLDTQRFRFGISRKLMVSPESVLVYVVGEHGDSQFAATSVATVGGVPFSGFDELSSDFLLQMESDTRARAQEIIRRKGSTNHGVAACVGTIVETVFLNKRRVLPLSVLDSKCGVCISKPVVLGRGGIERVFTPKFDVEEQKKYDQSCHMMRQTIDSIENE